MNLLASILRTAVPLLAGYLLTVTGLLGLDVDSTQAAALVTAAVTAAYYLLLRLAEQAAARIGWEPARYAAGLLLGWARSPEYGKDRPVPGTIQVRLNAEAFGADLYEAVRRNIRLDGSGDVR